MENPAGAAEIVGRSCGVLRLADQRTQWRVWAPTTEKVDLVLIDERGRQSFPMTRDEEGVFSYVAAEIAEGQRYAYRLDGKPERPDPASLWQPDGVHHASAVYYPDRFPWTDHAWKGVQRDALVFYEMHVGTFTREGTFEAVIPRLAALRELGITAIEIMPVAQFPGARNWGYDGVHLFAVQNSYGGPLGLQRLVDACHNQGLAVFLDVVYNHFGPEGNYIHEFGPYYSERYRTPWGPAFNFDGPGSDAVRDFVLDNVRLWIQDFHLDGLRLDAVHAMYDNRPRHILREIKEEAEDASRLQGRPSFIIVESLMNDVRMLLNPDRGGYALDAEWNEDFHHALIAYLTGERHGKYVDFGPIQDLPRVLEQTFVLTGNYSRYRRRRWGGPVGDLSGDRFVIGIQNHDHIGNRARGDRIAALVEPATQRLAASLMLLAPHLPLLFMGEEYGEQTPFLFFCSFDDQQLIENVRSGRRREYSLRGDVPDPQHEETFNASRLTWSWPPGTPQAGLRQLYQDLLRAHRNWPPLRNLIDRSARLIPDNESGKVLEFIRGSRQLDQGQSLLIFFNLSDKPQRLPERAENGPELLMSSEAKQYGGLREGSLSSNAEILPHECLVFGRLEWQG